MAQQFDVESGFISKLLQERDFTAVKDAQIKTSYFTGESKNAFRFIYDTTISTGEVPTLRVFERKFPNYHLDTVEVNGKKIVGTEENMKYWCDELRTKVKHNKIADFVTEAVKKLEDFETEDAYAELKKGISYIESEVVETQDADITKNTEDRKAAYLKRKDNKGMLGLSTGIKHLDYLTKGLKKETLTTLIAGTGVGKRLDLRTPILTPNGFVPLKDIHVGSIVCGEDGKFYPVVHETPVVNTQVHRITFEDGTYVDCCSEHLWKFKTTDDVSRGNDWRVLTTEEIMSRFPIKRGRSYNLCIPVNSPVKFGHKELPLDPYALGCLLGDGGFTTDSLTFTNTEEDVVQSLNDSIEEFGKFVHRTGHDIQYVYKRSGISLFDVLKKLNLRGVYSTDKFIPEVYLVGSVEQRMSLLEGLINTDGHADPKGHTSFSTSSPSLCRDVVHLVRSLGYRCSEHSYDREGKGTEYRVRISTSDHIGTSIKHLQRYRKSTGPKRVNHYGHLKIVSIEVLDTFADMKCLSVNSPDHTFICGDFIVTHNTWFEIMIGAYCQLQNCRVLQLVTEMSEDIMRDRYEAMLYSMCYGEMNYARFKAGSLSLVQEKQYFEFLENDLPNLEPLIIATASGVMGVSSEIEKYKPDLILIDGVYLMEDDQGAQDDWLRVAHITRDLKKLAKRAHVPIFINTQADKNTSKKTGPELGSIMFTQAIGQDSDDILALYRDEVMISDKEMGLKVLKQREGMTGKMVMQWDFDTMNFSDIYCETSEERDYSGDDKDSSEDNTVGDQVLG